MKKILRIISIIIFIAGAALIIYPNINNQLSSWESEKSIKKFIEQKKEVTTAENNKYSTLYEDMKKYNQSIYENGQLDLNDAWSYQQPIFELASQGVAEESIGYLSIDAMDLEIPLFLGATKENLAKGAAVLGQTSMPIGGNNTNCVIAGHRGWKGIPMFVDIEKLKLGDVIVLENLWDTLYYQVSEIKIIKPTEIDAIKIQENKDLLTLITCHPYRHNYERYVVYCEKSAINNLKKYTHTENIVNESSQKEIDIEERLNVIGLIVVIISICLLLLIFCLKKIKPVFINKKTNYL